MTPKWMLLALCAPILCMLIITIQQLLTISKSKKMSMIQRFCVLIVLVFELNIIVLQYIAIHTSTDYIGFIAYLLWFILMAIVPIIGYWILEVPSICMNKLWRNLSIIDSIFATLCAVFYILTKNEFYFDMNLFGGYFYALTASIIILISLYKTGKQIKRSISKLNKEKHSDNKRKKERTEETQTEEMLHTLQTLEMVDSALQKINITIILIMILIIFLLIACIWTICLRFFSFFSFNNNINTFIIHYFLIDILCGISIIYQCIFRNGISSEIDINKNKNGEKGAISIAIQKKISSPVIDITVINGGKENKNKNGGTPTGTYNNNGAFRTPQDSIRSPYSVPSILPFTAKSSRDVEYGELRLSPDSVKRDLNCLTDTGRPLGKRGKCKLTKLNTMQLQKVRENIATTPTLNDEILNDKYNIKYVNNNNHNNENTPTSHHSVMDVIDDILDTMEQDGDADDDDDDDNDPIKIIVFEFENCICTQIDKLYGKLHTFIDKKNLIQKQMYFGGIDRIKTLNNFLKNKNIRFFLISQEESKMIMKLLQNVELLKPFIFKDKLNKNKLISNVIGCDNSVYKQCLGKTYLILLKLLQNLSLSHNNMLFVSNNHETIQHLKSIKICKTYLVETKGLTISDMETIQHLYFSGDINK